MTAPGSAICGARDRNHRTCTRPRGHAGGHVSADGTYWQAEEAEATA